MLTFTPCVIFFYSNIQFLFYPPPNRLKVIWVLKKNSISQSSGMLATQCAFSNINIKKWRDKSLKIHHIKVWPVHRNSKSTKKGCFCLLLSFTYHVSWETNLLRIVNHHNTTLNPCKKLLECKGTQISNMQLNTKKGRELTCTQYLLCASHSCGRFSFYFNIYKWPCESQRMKPLWLLKAYTGELPGCFGANWKECSFL